MRGYRARLANHFQEVADKRPIRLWDLRLDKQGSIVRYLILQIHKVHSAVHVNHLKIQSLEYQIHYRFLQIIGVLLLNLMEES